MSGFLIRPDVALKQHEAEKAPVSTAPAEQASGVVSGPAEGVPTSGTAGVPGEGGARRPKRFHGTVNLDPARVGRDAGRIADEVISHLSGLVGSSVKVTLEIEAAIETGAPENVVRTVTENSRTLKFTTHGFEEE
jgi:hypothetical protein